MLGTVYKQPNQLHNENLHRRCRAKFCPIMVGGWGPGWGGVSQTSHPTPSVLSCQVELWDRCMHKVNAACISGSDAYTLKVRAENRGQDSQGREQA